MLSYHFIYAALSFGHLKLLICTQSIGKTKNLKYQNLLPCHMLIDLNVYVLYFILVYFFRKFINSEFSLQFCS